MLLFFCILITDIHYSKVKIKEDQPPLPTRTPTATRTPLPTKSYEIIVMNPLKSNTISPTLSVIAVVSLTIGCTVGIIYIIFYILPFLREDFLPLL